MIIARYRPHPLKHLSGQAAAYAFNMSPLRGLKAGAAFHALLAFLGGVWFEFARFAVLSGRADVEELQLLPGIGPKLVERIYRLPAGTWRFSCAGKA